jgi:hypothetical protein
MKCTSARKCQKKFIRKFPDIQASHRYTIQNLLIKLQTSGILIDKKTSQALIVKKANSESISP